MNRYKQYLIGCLLLVAICGNGQVLIQFNPVLDGTKVNRIANVSLNNRYTMELGCKVVITVKERRAGNLLRITTPLFNLNKGFNIIGANVFNQSSFSYSSSRAGFALSQTRTFLDGDYEYCFEVSLFPRKGTSIPTDFYDACFNQVIERSTPLVLINPYDREVSCNKRPNFLWQPSIPIQPMVKYTLQLVEIREKQSPVEAMAYNMPIVLQNNISGNMLNYPALSPPLEENKKYAWQVMATMNNLIISKSELWLYSINCTPEEKPTGSDGFRELKPNRDEGSYLTGRWLRFVFYNPYGYAQMNYTITDLTKKSKNLIKIPNLFMQGGFNKYELDLSEINGLIYDHQYLLTVTMPNGSKLFLGFIYKRENSND